MKTLPRFLKSLLFLLGLLLTNFSITNIAQATISTITSTTFSCDKIYAGTDNGVWVWSGTGGAMTKMYTQNTTPLANTIALGWSNGRDVPGSVLTMYGWNFDNGNQMTKLISGQTSDSTITTNLGTPWAGGEVNQITGEIYMGSFYAGYMSAPVGVYRFNISVFNPITGQFKKSSQLVPATTSDALISGQDYVSSDMAIDAEGNAYIIAGPYAVGEKYLLKVIPGEDNTTWKYTKVATLNNLPNPVNIWGMAFFNGELFAVAYPNQLYRINVLTGNSTVVTLTGSGMGDIRDLAACQVAPVIKGKVYLDSTGDGNITGSESGLEGISVQLWKDGVWQKSFTTGATGEYSFIVDSTNAQKYQIRILQPKIGGVNAVQSWASSDSSSVNPVAAYCSTDGAAVNTLTADGPCRGAGLYADDPISTITDGYIYTEVIMNSDAKVANASFALTTASNYGDAPSGYNTTTPAKHISPGASSSVNAKLNWLRLGDTVSVQDAPQPSDTAALIASHDGVEVSLDGSSYVSLQDATLVAGKAYTFRVKTTGPASSKGYLNAWIDWSASKSSGSFGTTRLATDVTGATDGGYLTFTYTVPSGSASGQHTTYARFRFSTTSGLGPNNDSLPTPSATVPWVVDGEVEDYRLYITTGELTLSTITLGDVGTFTYSLSNISATSPSSATDSLTTTTQNSKVSSTSKHVFTAVGSAITITQTSPSSDWGIVSAVCLNDTTTIQTTIADNIITIPASAVTEGANISCTITNGVTPKLELTKSISGTRFDAKDQFTVNIKDGSTVTATATTSGTSTSVTTNATALVSSTLYTLNEEMATGSASTLSRYTTNMSCTNSYSGSSTTLPSGSGQSFSVTPAYGDNIKCTLTNTSIEASVTTSSIAAYPTSIKADGKIESTITVTLKDGNGNALVTGGDVVTILFSDSANKKGILKSDSTGTENTVVTAKDNGNGTYTAIVTSTQAGSDSFTYTLNGTAAPATSIATVEYTADKANVTTSEISASPESITANGTDLSTITVTLKDANGNPLTSGSNPDTGVAYTVKLVVDTTSKAQVGTLQPEDGSMTNNGDGTFTAYVKSTVAGNDVLGFTIDGTAGTKQQTVSYTVGEPDANSSEINTNEPSIVADGKATSTVTVTLKDKYGNKLTTGTNPSTGTSYDVVILIKNNPAISDAVITTTDNGDGTFSAAITSTKIGTDTFSFTFAGTPSKAETQVSYTPGDVDLTKSTINASPQAITADGVDSTTVTVQLKDKYDNNLTTQAGDVVITGVNIATQAATEIAASYIGNGQYTITLTSTKTGTDSAIGFKLGTGTGDDTTSVTYNPGKVDLDQSTLSIDKESIVADGKIVATVTIQLKDAKGNNLTSSGGTAALVFNNGGAQLGTVVQAIKDNENGTYTATISSTKVGSDVIGYTLAGISSPNTKTLNYTAGTVDLTKSTIIAKPVKIAADGLDTSTIVVQLKDANENNLATNEGTVTIATVDTAIGSYTTELNYIGAGQYTGTVTSTKTGTDTFKYTLTGVGTGDKTASVEYTVGEVSLTKSTINAEPASIVADGVKTSTITVQLKDQYENNLTEQGDNHVYLVDVTTGYPSVNKTNFELTYVSAGLYQGTITSETAGFDNVGFKIGTSESTAKTATGTKTVTYTAGDVDLNTSTIIAKPESITANGTSKSTVTVQLKDAKGNNITTSQGTVTLTGVNVGTPNNSDYSLTFQSNGTYTGTLTSKVTGTDAAIKFKLSGNETESGKSASVTYTPGSVSVTQSTISASLPSITANYKDTTVITIQLKDVNGNNLTGDVTNTLALTGVSVGEIKTALAPSGNGTYQATVYSKVTGYDNIGFTIDGAAGGDSSRGTDKAKVTYTPGDANLAKSTITVDPDSIVANGTTTSKITVQLKDEYGNNLTTSSSSAVTIFISGTTTGTLSAVKDNLNGTYTATVTSIKTGSDQIDFSLGGIAANQAKTVTYTAGTADAGNSTISVDYPEIVADGTAIAKVTVQLKDANNNNITSSIGNAVSISIKNNPKIGTASTAVTDNQNGTYSITVTSTKTGIDTFGFTVLGTAGKNTTTVTYTPGAVDLTKSTITAKPSTIAVGGTEKSTITVQLKDKYSNNLTTNAGAVVLTGVTKATEGNSALTYNEGTGSYSGTLSSTVAGDDTVGYTLANQAGSDKEKVTYKSGGASLTNSTITIDKASIAADGSAVATVTVQLLDQYNNATYNNEVVVLTGINKGTQVTFNHVSAGKFVGTITSTKSGEDTIGFTVDSAAAKDSKTLQYTPDEASTTTSTITVNPSSIVADGIKTSTITVQLIDANGNKLTASSAKTIVISVSGTAKGTISTTTDNKDGTYTATITSTVVGTDTVGFSIGGTAAQDTKTVTYTPGAVSLSESTIIADPTSIVADGVKYSTISIQLKDAKGNNLNSNPGAVSLLNLNVGKIRTSVTYQGNGLYQGTITSTVSSSDTLGFTIAGYGDGDKTQVVTYTAGDVSLKESTISVSKPTIVANGTDASIVTVQLKDSQGNLIAADKGTVLLTNLDKGTLSVAMKYVSASGNYQGTVTSTQTGTDAKIGFTIAGSAGENTTSIVYTAGDVDLSNSLISASESSILADGKASSVITVQLRDANGNNLSTKAGEVYLSGVTKGTISSTKLTYQGNGVYTGTLTSTQTGSDTIGYNLDGKAATGNNSTVTVKYTAGDVDISVSTIEVNPATIVADGTAASTITVTLKDKNGNKLESKTGTVILKGITTGTVPTDVNNVTYNTSTNTYVTSVKSKVTGTDTISFTFTDAKTGTVYTSAKSKVVTYIAGTVDPSKSSIEIDKASIKADDIETATVTVTLRDANNNLVKSTSNEVKLNSSNTPAIGSITNVTPDGTGVYTFTIKSAKTGTEKFTYQYNTGSGLLNGTGEVQVKYTADGPSISKSTITIDKSKITADGKDSAVVTVTLKDANDNLVPGYTDLSLIGKDSSTLIGTVSKPVETSDGVYQFTVTSISKVGTDTFVFKTATDTSIDSVSLEYTNTEKFNEEKSTIVASPVSIEANGKATSTVTVTLYYDTNNTTPMTGVTDLTLASKSDGTSSFVGSVSAAVEKGNGVYEFTVTSTTKGADKFYIHRGTQTSTKNADVAYTNDGPFNEEKSTIVASPVSIEANGKATSTVTVTLYYDTNNTTPMTGVTDLTLASKSDGTSSFVGSVSAAVEKGNGVYEFTVTSTTKGADKFYIHKGTQTSTKNADVTYTNDGPFNEEKSTIVASPVSIEANGKATSTVTVTLYYDTNNTTPMTGVTDLTLASKSDGTSSFVGSVSAAVEKGNGVYEFTVTSTTKGADKFYIHKGTQTSTKNADVAYTNDGPFNEEKSTIVASPVSIEANGKATSTVTVTLYYDTNNTTPMTGVTDLTLASKSDGTSSFVGSVSAAVEKGNGVYEFTVTSTTKGSDKFYIHKGTQTSTKNADVTYTNDGPFNEEKSTIVASPVSIEANGKATSTVTVTLYYDTNNTTPMTGVTDLTLASKSDGTSSFVGSVSAAVEKGNGVYEFTVTSTTKGADKFYIHKGTQTSTKNADVAYTNDGPFNEEKSTIVASPVSIEANGKATSTVTVTLYYDTNNTTPMTGVTDLTLASKSDGTSSFVGSVSAAVEKGNGVYEFTVTSTTKGADKFYIHKGTQTSTKNADVTYTNDGPFNEEKSTIVASPVSIEANGKATSTVTVTLYYDTNNTTPMTGVTDLTLASKSDGTSSFVGSVSAAVEKGNGVYEFTVTSTTKGSDKFYIHKGTQTSTKNADVAYTNDGPFNEEKSTIVASPVSIEANGKATSTVTVTLYYDTNNTTPMTGVTDLTLASKSDGTSSFVGSVSAAVEKGNGVYEFTVTSTTKGSDKFYIHKGTQTSTKNADVTYTNDGPFNEEKSTIVASPVSIEANGKATSTVTVTLYYDTNNTTPMTGVTDLTLASKSDGTSSFVGSVSAAVEKGNGVYEFTVTSTTKGADKFYIHKGTQTSTKNAGVAYTNDGPFNEEKSTIVASPVSIEANGKATSTVTVTLYYDTNNTTPMTGVTDLTLASKSDGTSSFVGSVSAAVEKGNGVYEFTVTSTTKGADKFYIHKGTQTSTKNADVAYTNDGPFNEEKSTIVASPVSIEANGKATSTVTVTLYYDTNNTTPMTGVTDLTLASKSDGTSSFVGSVSAAVEKGNGVYEFTVTSTTKGADKFYIHRGTQTSTKNADVAYTNDGPFNEEKSTIVASPVSIEANGKATSTVTVTLYYDTNNTTPMTGVTDLTLASKSDGTSSFVGSVSAAVEKGNGVYEFTVTSTTKGADKFYIHKGTQTSTKNADVAYTNDGPFNEEKSTIVASPVSIEANGKATSTVTVTLYYDTNNTTPMTGVTDLTLASKSDGTSSFVGSVSAAVEKGNGVYEFTVTSTTKGSDKFYIHKGTQTSTKNADVTYTNDGPFNEEKSTIVASPVSIEANGKATSTVTVTLYYDTNNTTPMTGVTDLTLASKSDGTSSFVGSVSAAVEKGNGVYEFTVTSTTKGADKFYIHKGTQTSTKNADVAYTNDGPFNEEKSTIVASPVSIEANGKATSTVTVTLYYDTNNTTPMTGVTDLTLASKSDGTSSFVGSVSAAVEKGNGVYEFTVTSTTKGADKFYIHKGTQTSTKNADVTYTNDGPFNEEKSTIVASPVSIEANGKATSTVTVTLYYDTNNTTPMTGVTDLTLASKSDGTSSFVGSVSAAVEKGNGVYEFTVTSTTKGSDKFYIHKGTQTSTKNADVAYTNDGPFNEEKSTIVASPVSIEANGKATSTVTVTLYYDTNNTTPMTGVTDLTLASKSDGTSSFVGSVSAAVEKGNGVYEFTVTSTTKGSDKFYIHKGTQTSTKNADVTYTNDGPFNEEKSTIVASPVSIEANGKATSTVTVTLYYDTNNTTPMTGVTDLTLASKSDGTSSFVGSVSAAVEKGNGVYEFTVTSTTKGADKFYIHKGTQTSTKNADVTYTNDGPFNEEKSTIVASPVSIEANGKATSTVTVTLYYDTNNTTPMTGVTDLTLASKSDGTSSFVGSVSAAVEKGNGVYEFTVTSTTKGSDKFYIHKGTQTSTKNADVTYTNDGPFNEEKSTIVASPVSIEANGKATSTVTVTLYYDTNNTTPMTGVTDLTLASKSDGTSSFVGSVSAAVEKGNGVYEFTVTSTTKGADKFYIHKGTQTSTKNADVAYTNDGPFNEEKSTIVASPVSIEANGKATSTVTVTLYYDTNNTTPMTGVTDLTLASKSDGTSSFVGSVSAAVEKGNGVYEFTVTSTTKGADKFYIHKGTQTSTKNADVTYTNDGPFNEEKSTIVASPVSIEANGKATSTVTVTLYYDTNNTTPMTGVTDLTLASKSDGTSSFVGSVSAAVEKGNGVYEFTVTSTTKGADKFYIHKGTQTSTKNADVTYTNDGPFNEEKSTIVASPVSIEANGKATSTVTVTLYYDTNNTTPMTGVTDLTLASKSDGTSSFVGSVSAAVEKGNGVYEFTVTSTTKGSDKFYIHKGTQTSTKNADVAYTNDGPFNEEKSTIVASPVSIEANGKATSTVTVTLYYDTNNTTPMTGVTDLTLASKSDGTSSFVGSVSAAVEKGNGVYEFTVTSTTKGSDKFYIHKGTQTSTKNVDVTYTNDGPFNEEKSTIVASPVSIEANGKATSTVTVTLYYDTNNTTPMTGVTDLTLASKSDGTSSFVGSVSAAVEKGNGVYEFTVTSTTKGSDKFYIHKGTQTSTKNADVAYTNDGPFNEEKSTIVASPVSIEANGKATSTVTVTLYYDTNNTTPMTGVTDLTLASKSDGTSSFVGSVSAAVEKGNGVYEFTVTSTTKGADKFYIHKGTQTSTKNADVAYTNDGPFNEEKSTIVASPVSIEANGKATSTVTVTLYYDTNNTTPMTGVTDLTLASKSDGTSSFVGSVSAAVEKGNGVYEFTVTSTTKGADKFYIHRGTQTSTKNADVAYTNDGPFNEEKSTIVASPVSIEANGKATSTVTVTLYYDTNNTTPMTGVTDLTLASKSDGTSSFVGSVSAAVEKGNGVYEFTVTSTTKGADKFYIHKGTQTSTKNADVTYTNDGPFNEEKSTIVASPVSIEANGKATSTVTVTLYYDTNNTTPMTGVTDLTLASKSDGTSSFVGSVSAAVEKGNGVYEFTVTSTTKGSDKFYIHKGTQTSTKNVDVAYTNDGPFNEEKSTIVASPVSIEANGKATSTVTVTLYYDTNNTTPMTGVTDLTLASKSDGTSSFVGSVSAAVEKGNGVYEFTVTSTTKGSDKFYIHKGTQTSTKNVDVTYTNDGPFNEEKSTIVASPVSIEANGKATSTVTVTLYYDTNNTTPMTGVTDLTLASKSDGTSSFVGSVSAAVEKGNGVYEFTVTSTTKGADKFYIHRGTQTSTKNADVAYTNDGPFNEEKSTIVASPVSIEANGKATSTVTVTLYYDTNNTTPMTGVTDLTLASKSDGTSSFVGSVSAAVEKGNGVYEFTVTSTTKGADKFYIHKGTQTSTKNADVTYTNDGPFNEEKSTIVASPVSIEANGKATSTVTVTLYYDTNNTTPMTGVTDLTLASKSDGTSSFVGSVSAAVEKGNGVYEFTVTSTTKGSDKFYIHKGTQTSTKNADVTYTNDGPFSEEKSSIEAAPTTIVSDGVDVSTITVKLFYKDNDSVPLTGYEGLELTSSDGSPFKGKVLTGPIETVGGTYVFTVSSKVNGSDTFYIKKGTQTSTKNATVVYAATGPFSEDASSIEAEPTTIFADGKTTSTVTVKLFYASDSTVPISGYEGLELARKDGGSIVGKVTYVGETADGVYQFTVTSGTVGSDQFVIKAGKQTSDKSATVSYISGSKFDQNASTIKAEPTEIKADGTTTSTISITMYYESDPSKLLTGYQGLELVRKDGSAIVGDVTYVGETNGTYTFTVTSKTEGSDEFVFKTSDTTSTKSTTVTYLSAESVQLLITLKASDTTVKIGDVLLITAKVENIGTVNATGFDVLNTLPSGFSYVASSAATTSSDSLTITGNSPLDLGNLNLAAGKDLTLNFVVRAGAGLKAGSYTFYSEAFGTTTTTSSGSNATSRAVSYRSAKVAPAATTVTTKVSISNRASITVSLASSDPLFDESLIIGTVYHDRNGNGIQDDCEPGIPGVKIVSAEGLIITTDQYGRYHLEGIPGGKWDRGRNFILKVDPASLPKGTTFVSKNPLVRRITPGLPVRFDFAVQLPKEKILEVSDKLFVTGKADIKEAYANIIKQMVEVIKKNDIKEINIVGNERKVKLLSQREESLRALLNSMLDDEYGIIVSSNVDSAQEIK